MRKYKVVLQACCLLLCVGFSSSAYCQIDTSYSLEYMTDTLVLGAHPLSSQFKLKHNSVYISRKSKELAGTFDDPSRVLKRHVGISTGNDQANGIIYHGLPSDFTKWTIHGAEIVNPNHTSNAGTFSDISSQSAGGVLGIPFDVINTFSFHANTHVENTPTTIAGVANFNFDAESENFFKIGLLGLEVGTQTKKSRIPVKTHFRYSTVGLIGQLGVDFGGEKIAFSDGFVQLGLKPHLNFISGGGFSSNIFKGVENIDDAETQKDLTNVDFRSYFFYSGLVFDKNRKKHTLMFSRKEDTRIAESSFIDLFPKAEFDEYKVSYAGQFPILLEKSNGFDLLVNGTYSDVFLDFPQSNLEQWRMNLLAALRYRWFNDQYSFSAKVGPKFNFYINELSPEFSFIGTRHFDASSLEVSSSISSQEQSTEVYGIPAYSLEFNDDLRSNKSFNIAATYKSEFRKNQKLLFRLFYHYLYDLAYQIGGRSPSLNIPYTDDIATLSNLGRATNYGLELMYDHQFENDFYINFNLTLFEFKQIGQGISLDLDPTNNFSYISNINFSKSWELKKEKALLVNLAFHLRGGAFDYFDITNPIRLKPYFRSDARVQYEFKKSILSLDIQNLTNRRNDAFYYFDELLQEEALQLQLGLIPVFSWKRFLS